MSLEAFSQRDIITARYLMAELIALGVETLAAATVRLEKYQHALALDANRTHRQTVERAKRIADRNRLQSIATGVSLPMCPSCGRSRMVPVSNDEGLRIIGCRRCRYTTLIPEQAHGV